MMEPLMDRPLRAGGSARERLTACFSLATLRACLPILGWLPRYNLTWLQMDYGLYSAFMGGFIYCVFGTSKDITLGPTAIMSLLCAAYIDGFLLDFISYPVIKGFTCAAAVTIGFGQLKNLLGLKDIPHQFFLQVYYTFYRIPQARTLGPDSDELPVHVRAARGLVCGFATMRNALVVVAATVVAYSLEVSGHHTFTITGQTSQGLPPFQAPPFSETILNGTDLSFSDIVLDLGGGLIVIPLMGLLESIAIAKAFASQNDYRIDGNQELFAIGEYGLVAMAVSPTSWAPLSLRIRSLGVLGGMKPMWETCLWSMFICACKCVCLHVCMYVCVCVCVCMCFSSVLLFLRTAVNSQTGVRTPAGGVVTGVLVLLSLAFLMPVFYYIPKASLAAVVICAVAPMFDLRVVPKLWRVRKLDLLPFLVTFLVCFWQVHYGIVGGVLVSMVMLLHGIARPKLKVSDHDVLVIELNSGLNFPAADYLSRVLYTDALQVSPPRSVVLDCHHVSSMDFTVVQEISDLLRQFQLRNAGLVFCGLSVKLHFTEGPDQAKPLLGR
ncbi:hypothetical protein JZ751_007507 [Albula glossodonta]|uniref:STAS domain-containing protein n=1 Tax=Albula glossodonta TaxID=121402 RepID=A0A8T2N7H3_9TELE|nr:hypothetical protein JZ751_007507 [Albula glossodonta]